MDLKILLLAAAFLLCSGAAPKVAEEDKKFITSILEQVPETERKQFVIHQLYKGYILNHPNDVAIPVADNTTLRLYNLFLTHFILSPIDLQTFDQLCFPSGECVDTDDPGAYP
ncbi:hypothetical protein NQ315_001178 [Exocentrus adspersus]|uniref:Uncharacterized protein n=1 Tax=Exocentrus adspersus TaxID=1586481 RepID=A0AAV8WFK9_9CUCU|nr:hypothetical protein NQ315_001178 [Exocentrus adspersus]